MRPIVQDLLALTDSKSSIDQIDLERESKRERWEESRERSVKLQPPRGRGRGRVCCGGGVFFLNPALLRADEEEREREIEQQQQNEVIE